MNQDIELAFIGCGNMGGAILDGILDGKTLAPEKILVVERSEELIARWSGRGVRCTERLEEARRVPRILLAVKPQMFAAVAGELGPLPTSSLEANDAIAVAAAQHEHAAQLAGKVVLIVGDAAGTVAREHVSRAGEGGEEHRARRAERD